MIDKRQKLQRYRAMSPEERLRADYEESKRPTIEPTIEPAFKVDEELYRDLREPLPDELPDHLIIAGYKVLVECPDDPYELGSLAGHWMGIDEPYRILVDGSLSIKEQWHVLFHEVVHAHHDLVEWRRLHGHIEAPSLMFDPIAHRMHKDDR